MDHSYATHKKAADHSYFTERVKHQLKDHSYFTVGSKTPKVVQERRLKPYAWPESHQERDHCYVKAALLEPEDTEGSTEGLDCCDSCDLESTVPVEPSSSVEENMTVETPTATDKEKENRHKNIEPKLDRDSGSTVPVKPSSSVEEITTVEAPTKRDKEKENRPRNIKPKLDHMYSKEIKDQNKSPRKKTPKAAKT